MPRRLTMVRPEQKPSPQAVLKVVHDKLSWPAVLVVGALMLFGASVASAITLAARPAAPVYLPTLVQVVEQTPAYDDALWLTQPEPSQWLVYWIDGRGVLEQTWCQSAASRDVLLDWISGHGDGT